MEENEGIYGEFEVYILTILCGSRTRDFNFPYLSQEHVTLAEASEHLLPPVHYFTFFVLSVPRNKRGEPDVSCHLWLGRSASDHGKISYKNCTFDIA